MNIDLKVWCPEQFSALTGAIRNAITSNQLVLDSFVGKSQLEIDRNQGLRDLARSRIALLENLLEQLPTQFTPKGKR